MNTDVVLRHWRWASVGLYLCLTLLGAATTGCRPFQTPALPLQETILIEAATATLLAPLVGVTNSPAGELAPLETETLPAPSQQPVEVLTPAPQGTNPLTHYRISARYDHAHYALAVSQQVDYINQASVEIADLVFLVEPNRYPGAFQLEQLSWGDGAPVENYALTGNRLVFLMQEPLQPGAQITLHMEFRLDLPPIPEDSEEYKPVPFGYTARQVNLVDWYPFLPPYKEGEGWLAHDPWFFGEHQVYEMADYAVEIEVSGSQEPLVLAASSLPESQEGDIYHYRLGRARTFVLSLSPMYKVYTQQVGETTVLSYGLPYFEDGAQAALQYTAEALALYNDLFGAYPRSSLSVVVADFLDGMEYDGLYFLSRGFYNIYDGTPAGYLTIIAVHETAHQWWYGQVGNDQAYEPWLDEAMCTYAERLYYERLRPELVNWWWSYRVDYYEPAGFVNGSIYDYAGFRPYRDAVYLRGAQFMEAVRQRVGDEAFFSFLRAYPDRMSGKVATAQDFFEILEAFSTEDIDDLRQQFFKP